MPHHTQPKPKQEESWEDRAFVKFGTACPDGWITFIREELERQKKDILKSIKNKHMGVGEIK